jgi:hypothetical protein
MFLVNSYQFGGVVPSIDPDAQAFLTAAAITDPTITSAIDTLVVQLKADGIWTKMKAIYPFVGGTATTHKYNLKDPRDLDVAFRLQFFGGITHSSNGITGNASNGYANTFFNPNNILTANNTHTSIYSRTNIAQTSIDFGGESSSNINRIMMHLKWSDNNSYNDMYNSISERITYSQGISIPSTRLYIASRTSNVLFKLFRDGAQVGTNTNTVTGLTPLPNINMFICARNSSGVFNNPSSRNYAFTSIGDGLTDTEAVNLTTAVNTFQTSLSRQV